MPSLIDLRRRIRVVKNMQQITKAMKMVAASRLRRAQERMMNARPYARQMQRVLGSVALRVDPSAHPLLAVGGIGPTSKTLVVIVTADKGLCGSFNTNIIKAAAQFIAANSEKKIVLGLIGRKGRDFFLRRGYQPAIDRVNIFQHLKFEDARDIANMVSDLYTEEKIDAVYLVYNEFKSVLQQRLITERLLPIPKGEFDEVHPGAHVHIDYIYEPNAEALFATMLPGYVRVQVWRALLESAAAENAARMTAMDAATKNATDMIDALTLYMNKVRQAGITREIIEVVSGAQAL